MHKSLQQPFTILLILHFTSLSIIFFKIALGKLLTEYYMFNIVSHRLLVKFIYRKDTEHLYHAFVC